MAQSEISVRLGGDNAEFRSMMADSVREAGQFSDKLSSDVTRKVAGIGAVSTAVATALGLNLQNIAENAARFFTGMSEEVQKSMEQAQQAAAAATDKLIASWREGLSDTLKLVQLQKQSAELLAKQAELSQELGSRQKRINDLGWDLVSAGIEKEKLNKAQATYDATKAAADEKQVEINKLLASIREKQNKDDADADKGRIDANEKKNQAALTLLDGEAKIAKMKGDVVALEKLLATGSLDQINRDQLRVTLQERKNALVAEEATQKKALADKDKKDIDDHIAGADELAKLKFDALTTDQKIAKLGSDQAELTKNIARMKREGKDTVFAEVELMKTNNQLNDLRAVRAKEILALEQEIAKVLGDGKKVLSDKTSTYEQHQKDLAEQKKTLVELLGTTDMMLQKEYALTGAGTARTNELEHQHEILQTQIEDIEEQQRSWDKFMVSITTVGAAYGDQSTAALKGTLARLRSQISPEGMVMGASGSSIGSVVSGFYNNAAIMPQIEQIEQILQRRGEVQSYASRFGEQAARGQYGDSATENALREMKDQQTRATNAVEAIAQGLAAKGFIDRAPIGR